MMIEMRGKPREVAERQWKKMSRGLSVLPYAVSAAERIVNEDKSLIDKELERRVSTGMSSMYILKRWINGLKKTTTI